MSENRRKVAVSVEGGLGNRMRALVSAMYLAERFDLSILLDWTPSAACQCNFRDLFDNNIELISRPLDENRKAFYEGILSKPIRYYGRRCMEDPVLKNMATIPERDSDIGCDGDIVYESPDVPTFIGRKSRAKFLGHLRIKREILSAADSFCKKHQINKKVYGVHIRRTDAAKRDDKFYTAKMDAIISKDTSARFFLCSDSKETEESMAKMYPGRVIIKPKDSYSKKCNDDEEWVVRRRDEPPFYNVFRDKQSVIDALQDFVILTRTTFSIRSNGSFSDIVQWWDPEFKHSCRIWKKYRFKTVDSSRDDQMDQYLIDLLNRRKQFETVKLEPVHRSGYMKDGVSIITACRNRKEQLKKSLKSWLKCTDVAEIVVVDWSSENHLSEWITSDVDNRIKLIRVDTQDRWILTHAFNLAARFASCRQLCKMDADYRIDSEFFKHHRLEPGTFYCGDHRQARDINEKHLNGFLFLNHEDFFRVNGYNERILVYGWDDTDICNRLTEAGLTKKSIDNDLIEHIQHSDRQRANHNDKLDLDLAIQANKRLCKRNPWNHNDLVTKFRVEQNCKNYIRCEPVLKGCKIVSVN